MVHRQESVGRPRRAAARRQLFNSLLSTTALVAVLAPIGALPVRAQTVWTGTVSNNWFTAGNWTAGGGADVAPPNAGTNVAINNGGVPNPANVGAAGAVARTVDLGTNVGQSGILSITGGTLSLAAAQNPSIMVGNQGSGTLDISAGGTLTSAFSYIATNLGSSGTATVTGTGSLWTANNGIDVGSSGNGTLNVLAGAHVNASVTVGSDNTSVGNILVSGTGSQLNGGITVGNASGGTGTVQVAAGGAVSGTVIRIGAAAGSTGTVTVTGTGSTLGNGSASFAVGPQGNGTLNVQSGATVTAAGILGVAAEAGGTASVGALSVSGTGSTLGSTNLLVGTVGTGTMTISAGGVVNTTSSALTATAVGGNSANADGAATVTGANSAWNITGTLRIGGNNGGSGALSVLNGGAVSAAESQIGYMANGPATVTVSGTGSSLQNTGQFIVGSANNSLANLTISNGGGVTSGLSVLGSGAGSSGTAVVTGPGSSWGASSLSVGGTSTGTLTIADGATVTLGSGLIAGSAGVTGTLNIGAAAADPAAAPGTLNATTLNFGAGSGTINFKHASSSHVFGPAVSGTGTVNLLAGTTIFTGDHTYAGTTTVANGATLQLGNGGTTGSVATNITNNGALVFNRSNGATYAGAVSGGGTLTQAGSGTLTLTGDNVHTGLTTISAGTLNIGGNGASGAVAGNILNNAALVFQRADALVYNGVIAGAGTLEKLGIGNLTLGGASTFAGGTAISLGTLTLGADDRLPTAGALAIGTGTFALAGFNQTVGDLSGTGGTISLGSGTLTAGAANSTTLASTITGSGNLIKQGAGTLTLTADNSYTGLTTIAAGTLNIGGNGATGAVAGNILDNANLTFERSNDLTFDGTISGSGALQKSGAGNLTLGGANTFTGGTTITAGMLTLAANDRLPVGGALTMTGGILDLNGFSQTVGDLSGSGGTIALGAGVLTASGANATSFAGVITGSGGLIKQGAGTLTLAGNSTYAGGTLVSAGTLRLGADNALPVGGALMLTSGTFALDGFSQVVGDLLGTGGTIALGSGTLTAGGANATSYAGEITGTGGFIKQGSGTLIFDGTKSYSGPTAINAGTLLVNGTAANSAMTVNNGGTLGGTGTVGSTTVNSGGTLSPGNSIGVLNINGNLVLGPGSVYRVEVSPTAADRTDVTGTAALGGTVHAIFSPGSYTSRNYTILSATGGRSGTFDTLTTSGLPETLSASLAYTASDVLLVTLTSQIAPTLPKMLSGVTPNQKAVAAAQDTAFNSGKPNISALYGLALVQLPAALDALSGEVHASTAGVLVDESRYMRGAVLGRLRQASYGGDGGMAALSLGGPQTALQDEELLSLLAYGKSPVGKAPKNLSMPAPQATHEVVFWAQGFGAWGRFDGDRNAASVRRDLAGVFTGVDGRVGTSGRAGIAVGYTGSKNALDGRGSADVETAHVAGYGGWSFGAVNLRAGGAYAVHTIDTDRTIAFPGFFDRATAHYDARTAQVFGELGYGFAFDNVAVEPFAGGAWVRFDSDAAAERAAVAGLNVAANRFEVGYATLGIRTAALIPLARDMVLVPRVSLAWQHAFDAVTPAARLAFQNNGVGFIIAGVPIARDALLGEAGLDLAIGRNATVGLSYVGQLAGNVRDHSAKGRFNWRF